jgi:hypothetical protein
MASLNMTQFQLTEIFGKVMNVNPNTISARVVSTSAPAAGYLQAGDFVTFHPTEVGNAPVVQPAVSGALIDGVIIYNAKSNQYNALDMMEIALSGSIITCQSGGAFNRGVPLNYVPGTVAGQLGSVFSTTSANGVGESLDISTAAGQVVRVKVKGAY